jgi:Bifunctional DNA primase/polymerase, N-terminal
VTGAAYGAGLQLYMSHGLLSVPARVERHPDGTKRVQPLAKYAHLWDVEPSDAVMDELWADHEDAPGLGILLTERNRLIAVDPDTPEAEDWASQLLGRARVPSFRSLRGTKRIFRAPPV